MLRRCMIKPFDEWMNEWINEWMNKCPGGSGSSTDGDCCDTEANSKKRKSKRNRTTFTDEQIHILQVNML